MKKSAGSAVQAGHLTKADRDAFITKRESGGRPWAETRSPALLAPVHAPSLRGTRLASVPIPLSPGRSRPSESAVAKSPPWKYHCVWAAWMTPPAAAASIARHERVARHAEPGTEELGDDTVAFQLDAAEHPLEHGGGGGDDGDPAPQQDGVLRRGRVLPARGGASGAAVRRRDGRKSAARSAAAPSVDLHLEHVVLGRKVPVEGADGDVRLRRDLFDGDVAEPSLLELPERDRPPIRRPSSGERFSRSSVASERPARSVIPLAPHMSSRSHPGCPVRLRRTTRHEARRRVSRPLAARVIGRSGRMTAVQELEVRFGGARRRLSGVRGLRRRASRRRGAAVDLADRL